MHLRIALAYFALSVAQAFAATTITPTTTVAAESGNNTSAASSFQAQTNGNIAPGNVSKVPTGTLLYTGYSTQIYAHFMPWFGRSNHMNVGYDSTNPAQVKAQVSDMISRGIAGLVIDWYGPSTSWENTASLAVEQEAQSRNGAFHFAIMEDAGSISNCANTAGCDITGALINDLQYIEQTYVTSPAYITWNGNPVIFYFGVESYNIDWTRVRANTASNLLFVFENDNGLTASYSNAGFSWVMPSDVTSSNPMSLNYMNDFYSTAQSHPGRVPAGAAYKGFNDSMAAWGSNRLMQQQCGQTWLATFNDANSWWSTSDQLAWFQLVTWNDYEEATEIETGIDNCFNVSASVSGSAVNWTISGNENTVDHYTVFISSDGQNLMSLGDYPAGTRNLNLGSYGFNSGTYSVYVKAVGKPSIVNHLSAAATYTVANGPIVVLNVTPTTGIAPLAVTASTAGSTDNQGTITSSSINFGDGTVISATSASHSYANPGTYTITATLNDSASLTGSQSTTVSVTTPQPPVAKLSITPASGTAPLAVTASTAASTDPQGSALTSTINFGDGTIAAGPSASHTYSSTGTYTITATVSDALSLSSQATASVNVSVAPSVNVTQPTNGATVASPIPVSANGSAPSGVAALQIYLDGTLAYQANASSFSTTVPASVGNHAVVVKLWDNLGNAYMKSVSVTVANAFATSLAVSPSSIATGGSVTATITATSGTMSSSQISWGDGANSSGPSASHVYPTAGSYTVTSTATSSVGTTSQATATVTVSTPAAVTISQPANNASVQSPIPVVASGSAPSGVAAMQIYLDGTLDYQVNASSFSTTITANPGTHAIVVKLWDNLGNTYSKSVSVTVASPFATSLSVTPSTINAGGSVTATVTATSGTIGGSQIAWGDGSTSTGPSTSHVYSTAGTYTVTSTASGTGSNTSQATAKVIVNAAAVAINLSQPANNASVHSPITVSASGSAPNGVDAMQIYLDGTLVYQANSSSFSTTVPASVGTHAVVVKLWDNLGNAYKQSLTVNVVANLVTALSLSQPTVATGGSVTATLSATSGTIATSTINWGDGSSSSGPSAAHTYASAGTYTVTGTASDSVGAAQPVSAAVTVKSGAFVVLQSPAPNSSVAVSMQVVGYASSPIGIVAMQIYVDGALTYQNALSQVSTSLNLSAGTHRITLKAWDTAGGDYMQTEYVTAQ